LIVERRGSLRSRPGLIVHHSVLPGPDVGFVDGCRVTSPVRTAWDLGRRLAPTEAVVAVDALAHRHCFEPAVLLESRRNRPHSPGSRRLEEVVRLADRRAESPMETRLRLLLGRHGLPAPDVQHRVCDGWGREIARLDLAYPDLKLGLEYDGDASHRERRTRDNHRDMAVAELGWETMRFGNEDIYLTPAATAARVSRMREARCALLGPH
jgi:very-short-patch-repair endonuclease